MTVNGGDWAPWVGLNNIIPPGSERGEKAANFMMKTLL